MNEPNQCDYEGDVFFKVWRRGENPDQIDYDGFMSFDLGDSFETAARMKCGIRKRGNSMMEEIAAAILSRPSISLDTETRAPNLLTKGPGFIRNGKKGADLFSVETPAY